jgi:hypothetical protein
MVKSAENFMAGFLVYHGRINVQLKSSSIKLASTTLWPDTINATTATAMKLKVVTTPRLFEKVFI